MKYIGDLARQDVQVLATYAARASRIVEFGVGASTQVIAEHARPGTVFESIDTDQEWIDRTISNLDKLDIGRGQQAPRFATWDAWLLSAPHPVDLAFDDGINELRCEFALKIWPRLTIGGVLLLHDTRHLEHVERTIAPLIRAFHNEIDCIRFNERASNITAVVKKVAEPFRNWNTVETLAEQHGWQ